MVESYSRDILKVVVAQICQTIGWHAIHSTAVELLTDVLRNYIHELGHTAHRYGEQFGHTIPTLDDVGLAFRDMGISVPELEEYVEYVASVPCAIEVPKYPIEKESHLNLLKPGSREVVTRPVHIHEHLPAMHPELEEEEYSVKQSPLSVDTSLGNETGSPPQSSPKTNIFKRPGDPVSLESPSLKRARLMLEEEGRPLREISSVMMTTSGFLSPAREGKLPEARTPIQPSDSRSNSPQPLSYPAVPPEVKGEKKIKKNQTKPGVDGIKKLLDKENSKAKESGNGDTQVADDDDPNVKKLVSMKELSKLKALKSGALKMMAQNSSNTQSGVNKAKPVKNKVVPPNFAPGVNVALPKPAKKIEEKLPKPEKSSTSPSPNLFKVLSFPEKVAEKTKAPDPSLVDGKLTSEPDKQKLNIFKKISKVKEEKTEPIDVGSNSRESSPILVVSDQENNRQREVRWAQISETIEAVIQRSREIPVEPSNKQQTENLDASDTELFPYDDDLSPPATPTTPRTPDLILPSRKLEKNETKKRKKDKNKDKKESKDRSLKSPSPKRYKPESNESDYLLTEKPKTPEVETIRDEVVSQTQQPPVFPFFPHFPPAPGLIPPPIGHNLFPRFNIPLVKPGGGLIPPHPAMPNLPIPPPLFMQPRVDDREPPKIKIPTPPPVTHPPSLSPVMPPTPPSTTPLKSELPEKVIHTSAITKEKEKSVEKEKKKEHKKDKKEKIKKKKDKKDKSKNKEKGEKRKDKGEKKERDKEKSKEKREKKEKKREKELQREEKEKGESSVPKITFKLGPVSPQQPPTPEPPTHRKIVIKPVLKKNEEPVKPAESVEVKKERERSPSPELARISALVTRPPKPKSLSKAQPLAPFAHSVQPLAEPSPQPPPPVLPQPSISTQGKKSTNTTNSSSPKIKQKDVPKKARDNEVKDTVAFYFDNEGNQVWICPACGGQDDGSPMIGCDGCDAWYHWVCVGIQVPPDSNDWFCRVCIGKKDELVSEKKKKMRKKKTAA